MGLNTAKIDSFIGGLNTQDPEEELRPNEFGEYTSGAEIVGSGDALRSRRVISHIDHDATGFTIPAGGTSRAMHMIPFFNTTAALTKVPTGWIFTNELGRIMVIKNSDPTPSQVKYYNILTGPGASSRDWKFEQMSTSAGVQKVYALNGVDTPQAYTISANTIANWPGVSIPNGNCLKVWKNMMCVAGVSGFPARLYYSRIADPENFSSPGGFIDIKSSEYDSEKIVALETVGENLLVFKENSLWLVFDPVNFENRRVAQVGCLNARLTQNIDELCYWKAESGVYSTNGDTIRLESKNVDLGATHELQSMTRDLEGNLIIVGDQVWLMYTHLTREDKQHPWVRLSGYGNEASTGNIMNRVETACFAPGTDSGGSPGYHGVCIYTNSSGRYAALFLVESTLSGGVVDETYDPVNFRVLSSVKMRYETPWLPVQGTENKERLRRLNIVGSWPSLEWGVSTDFEEFYDSIPVYAGRAFGTLGASGGQFPNEDRVKRVRPESRGRFHKIRLKYIGTDNWGHIEISQIELKNRGGKEH
jgi:hypothetical protein